MATDEALQERIATSLQKARASGSLSKPESESEADTEAEYESETDSEVEQPPTKRPSRAVREHWNELDNADAGVAEDDSAAPVSLSALASISSHLHRRNSDSSGKWRSQTEPDGA